MAEDSSVLAQLGWPDMRLPILYTLPWPERVYCPEIAWPHLDLCKQGSPTFKAPDNVKYPSMDLAYAAGRAGGTMTGVLSPTNEKVVEMFIDENLKPISIVSEQGRKTWDGPKPISIIGSTVSIGTQVKTFRPQLVTVRNESLVNELKEALADADYKPEIIVGEQGCTPPRCCPGSNRDYSSVLAQLGWPDIRLPILYTLSWPDRVYCLEITWPRPDLCKQGLLAFKAPNNVKYPSMDLAYAAGQDGGTMTGVFSVANEKDVEMFIDEK
ncbi:hypothetical protein GIB67_024916 [Kingdonia uniflora]|uniref:Uncharacterized protein n=1 Tax=Kingdonia uniflora TaxID=39325 RepID=A0A7J7NZD3_9MAGN|nr:hypothetical protein GIB67_024916 [Kingdonia uniflora]